MILYNKVTQQTEKTYGVQNDSNGYPMFLVYRNNQWLWRSAKHFKPIIHQNTKEEAYDETITQLNAAMAASYISYMNKGGNK